MIQNENLKKINDSLNSKNLKINISDISKKDYNNLLAFLNSKAEKEKLLYSLNELINMLKKNESIAIRQIYANSTYEHDMKQLVLHLTNLKLISSTKYLDEARNPYEGLKMGTSFKDFLNMDI
ncbi:hypothetical protein KHA90_08090 [Flavobacterium psychroterrae]|uniref:Uncharacterized protein n=1 Tax=Flavobacterium psychroterrae TaxID=2133767 RepID=A0ABS5P9L7_9FLAO|nr:hypothetical protein [Flavobacterium psychroterrae]MBS7230981.1 hypothetical protein [Flavobacterium psychroterrae]